MVVETRYVTSGEVFVAYQISGQDGPDLLMTPGFVSHLELSWENPNAARFLNDLGSFSRLIRFDKRGTGLSDRGVGVPHLDERIDDIRAVLDAAGSKRAYLFGVSEGGPMSILFAATYPERVAGLILFGTYARTVGSSVPFDDFVGLERDIRSNWGTGKSLPSFSPSAAAIPGAMERFAKFERSAASPSDVINLMRMNREIDVTAILPSIRVPTLVMHRCDDVRIRALAGRELGERIPQARYIELPGNDHLAWSGDQDRLVEEIRQFMGVSATAIEVDRVLSTVLFTDIVDSTRRAWLVGDRQWRSTLEAHHAAVRSELERHRGREVKTTGDGFLALFDGPARAVRCAQRIVSAVRPLDLEVRAGVHTGEVEMMGDDVGGIAVHIAARVAQHAKASEVLASSTVRDLVAGAGLKFVDQGPAELKGLSEPMRLFAAVT
ncbi:adenylate/guanylate cyclase domain-containing protein [Bradyrhizobium genosp. SA-3]|uniref:adenylate/guanylate cyclase domain-containing protein n=1 Tax=Bradyrhizobium genosp. SA-3 TaxID=508868 RepID=UPI0010293D56|nr:adenylate/guanylate cyclase domain-containing protein [Bradyrhizobium genosp. SA-3]RZM94794.1 adenylate/guanylate cyclase domain-containing protein [Bradyrhizobium genosp. SA-3]